MFKVLKLFSEHIVFLFNFNSFSLLIPSRVNFQMQFFISIYRSILSYLISLNDFLYKYVKKLCCFCLNQDYSMYYLVSARSMSHLLLSNSPISTCELAKRLSSITTLTSFNRISYIGNFNTNVLILWYASVAWTPWRKILL